MLTFKYKSFVCKSLRGDGDQSCVEGLRSYVKSMYIKSGYNGFSDDYDRRFDPDSVYFYVTDNSDIRAVQRVIHKTPNNLLPLENATVYDAPENMRYSINEPNVAEITSFVFNGPHVVDLLFSSVAYYGKLNKIRKAFALLDVESKKLKKIYCKIGWQESEEFPSLIYFPDYGKNVNGRFAPTLWKIMELPEKTILGIAENVKKFEVLS